MTTATVDNSQDILDSRDIIERIQELVDERQSLADETGAENPAGLDWDGSDELAALEALADEASSSPDWQYGEGLIRDSYFRAYAEQLAEDIGAVDPNANWPTYHIDWDAATDELKMDYFSVDFDGVEYWIRA